MATRVCVNLYQLLPWAARRRRGGGAKTGYTSGIGTATRATRPHGHTGSQWNDAGPGYADGALGQTRYCACETAATGSDPCQEGQLETDSAQIDFSGVYTHGAQCSWTLACSSGTPNIAFDSFQTEANYDFVDVYDTDGTLIMHESGDNANLVAEAQGDTVI